MSDTITLPGVSDDDNATLNLLLNQLDDCQQRNLLRASYYDGRRAIRQVGTIIPPMYYRLAMHLGWAGKAVDSLARRCNLDGLTWAEGDLGSIAYREVWNGNRLRTEISSAVISSLIHGVSFLVNTRGDESAGETAGLIHVKDATSATGVWNPRRRGLDNLLSITDRDDEGKPRALALYLDGRTIIAERDGSGWSVDQSEHSFGVPAEMLVYRPRVGRPFGYSRISPVTMSMHDAGLRTLIREEGHMDVFSFPEMWMLGAEEGIFKNPDGTQKASWQVMLGRIKGIPDDEDATNPRAEVKQFAASSPEPHISSYAQKAKNFAGEHDIPVSSLGIQAETNTTTEDGSNNAERNLIAEAEGADDDWTPAVLPSVLRAMAMAIGESSIPPEWLAIDADWRDPRFLSRAAQADAGMKILTAAPELARTEVGYEILGLTERQIRRTLTDQRRDNGSAALRAITDAVLNGSTPVVPPNMPMADGAGSAA